MSSYKEIVTKAVIGKGKKLFTTDHVVPLKEEASTISMGKNKEIKLLFLVVMMLIFGTLMMVILRQMLLKRRKLIVKWYICVIEMKMLLVNKSLLGV